MSKMKRFTLSASAAALVFGLASVAVADERVPVFGSVSAAPRFSTGPVLQPWMSPEIAEAWKQGFRGTGVTISVVDDFRSGNFYYGNLGNGTQLRRHGEWTYLEANMIAPAATMRAQDFTSGQTVKLNRGLNVLNLSYGMYAAAGYGVGQIGWSAQEGSIISYAKNGQAVIAKAAGNDAVAVGAANAKGQVDYLNASLVGTPTAIFVGALDRNGTVDRKAVLASYSNYAGSNTAVQKNFLTVGVRGDLTGLYGTSFAAPVVAGYAAVLGSKFTKASPTQITNQLLNTARTDTIQGYDAAVHGRGEASISRALAPRAIQ